MRFLRHWTGNGLDKYIHYEEAVSLTVKETRRHEPDPEKKEIYDLVYSRYIELYDSLKGMMK